MTTVAQKKFFVRFNDGLLEVRAAHHVELFQSPGDWAEVSCIGDHVSESGRLKLLAGKPLWFSQQDQSYYDLAADLENAGLLG